MLKDEGAKWCWEDQQELTGLIANRAPKSPLLVRFKNTSHVQVDLSDTFLSLSGANSILGRSLVVHADPDDLGKGGHELSKATGNAGGRISCGIIGIAKL